MMQQNLAEMHSAEGEKAADKEVYDMIYRNRASKLGPINIEDLKRQMAMVKQKNSGYFTNQLKSKPPLYTQ